MKLPFSDRSGSLRPGVTYDLFLPLTTIWRPLVGRLRPAGAVVSLCPIGDPGSYTVRWTEKLETGFWFPSVHMVTFHVFSIVH